MDSFNSWEQQNQINKCKIYVENLEECISDDLLYKTFISNGGKIVSLKIKKGKNQQQENKTRSAIITFTNASFAEDAIKNQNGNKIIKNKISVRKYFKAKFYDTNAYIFVKNLNPQCDSQYLEKYFSQFGFIEVADLNYNEEGKPNESGFVQFKNYEDAQKIFHMHQKNPLIMNGKQLTLESYKNPDERKESQSIIYCRGFTKQIIFPEDVSIQIYQNSWALKIQNYLKCNSIEFESVFVKYDTHNKQPWCTINFSDDKTAEVFFKKCMYDKNYECFETTNEQITSLILQVFNLDNKQSYSDEQIQIFLEYLDKNKDLYSFSSENFFINFQSQQKNTIDYRVLLIQNLKLKITQDDVKQFFEKFGLIDKITLKVSENPKYKNQQAIIQFKNEEDSKTVLCDIFKVKTSNEIEQIFIDSNPIIKVYLPSYKKDHQKFKSQISNSQIYAQKKLVPQWNKGQHLYQNKSYHQDQIQPQGQNFHHQYQKQKGEFKKSNPQQKSYEFQDEAKKK